MKLTILLPNLNLRGGTRVVLDYSAHLMELGVDVTVVFPTRLRRLMFPLNEMEYLWRGPQKLYFNRWHATPARIIPIPSLDARYIPRGDVLLATAWQTAEAAARYPADRGDRYYFIQDIETYGDGQRAAETYRLPFRRIAISPWVRSQLLARYGVDVHALIPNGLDFDLYRPEPRTERREGVVLGALHDPAPKKGFDVLMAAIEPITKQRNPVELHVLSLQRSPPRLPPPVRVHWKLHPNDTAAFYRSCDIWVCSSRSEGMHLPPLEAMACGCTVVTTRIGGSSYYAIPDRTALVCEPGDPPGLSAALVRVIEDRGLRRRLAEEGSRYVRRLEGRASAGNLLRTLQGEQVFIEPEHGGSETHCS